VGAIKTLIIGSGGMLGSDLCKVFPDAVKLAHRELDITNREQVSGVYSKDKNQIL
jgi:dTDP-4-dehydrorhamnose reductase